MIEVESLTRSYGDFMAVRDLSVREGGARVRTRRTDPVAAGLLR